MDEARPSGPRPDGEPGEAPVGRDGADRDREKGPGPGGGDAPSAAEPAPRRRPRPFPIGRLLVAATGIGLAVWLWLGSSWSWDVTPRDLLGGKPPVGLSTWVGVYVNLRGVPAEERPEAGPRSVCLAERADAEAKVTVIVPPDREAVPDEGSDEVSLKGRVAMGVRPDGTQALVVDSTRGRLGLPGLASALLVVWGAGIAAASLAVWKAHRGGRPGGARSCD